MTEPLPQGPNESPAPDVLARLAAHRTVGTAPRPELEWLVAHGAVNQFEPGDTIARKGEPVEALYIILKGRVSHLNDAGGTWRKVMDWRDGDVTGQLPYSRLAKAPGNSVIDESGSFVMPTVYAPERRALSSTRLMSSPSPDCETPTTKAWSSLSCAP